MRNRNVERAVRIALLAAGTVSGTAYLPAARAQDAGAQGQAAELEQVIVTGSRIPQPNLEGTSPVSLISNADIKVQGTQQVEDLINNMPQVFAGQGGNYSNGASGTATVNLRGLGSSRTKVLINGRGMVAGSPRGPEAPDLNQIPAPLIERVEVLTGGASAVYGSDAVAGVVNFIMKDNFEGVQFDGNYSFYNHKNSDDQMQDFVAARNYKQAPNSIGSDGDSYELSMLMGSNFADDKGNATFFVGYRNTDPLLQSERDYSACSLNSSHTGCGGSATSFPGNVGNYDFSVLKGIDPATGNPAAATNVFNFGPVNYWQRPDERWTASAFIHYDVTDNARIYSEFMFHDDRTVSQIAPSGAFGVGVAVDCGGGNPYLTQAWLDFLCADPEGIDANNMTTAYVLRRNVEGGGRQDDIRHTSYRGVIGVKGDVLENWNYDVSASYSTVVFSETYLNDFSNTRIARALDVVADEDGNPVCRSVLNGVDTSCVPYNIWQANGVTPEALAYLQIPLFSKGNTELRTVTATMASDLGAYGLKFPTANDGIGVAFGAEYREQSLDFQTDPNFASGDGAGQGGPTIGQSGGYNNMDLFAEVRMPILQGMPMADSLMLNASYRYSDYSNPINEKTNTYGVGLEWAPIKDFKVRGSYQRAVRAPSIIELFAAQGVGLYDNDSDPCAGDFVFTDADGNGKDDIPEPSASLEQCARTGVTADKYGSIGDNPAGQYNGLFGGNTDLNPETSDSYTLGFVFQPSFLDGLSVTVDYFDIKVEDVISTISPTISLQQCLEAGQLCEFIHRDAGQTLWLTPDAYIEAFNLNIGKLQTSGFDLDVRYMTDIGSMGTLGFSLVGTYLDELVTEPIAGSGSIGEYDCAGLYGSTCGTPNPEWRHSARVTWGTPWNVDLTLGWRYFDEVLIERTDSNPLLAGGYNPADKKLDAQNYIDVAASWTFAESYEVRLGINNVMDDDPPISSVVGSGAGNGNTYPQVYDALGRYVFMGFTAKF